MIIFTDLEEIHHSLTHRYSQTNKSFRAFNTTFGKKLRGYILEKVQMGFIEGVGLAGGDLTRTFPCLRLIGVNSKMWCKVFQDAVQKIIPYPYFYIANGSKNKIDVQIFILSQERYNAMHYNTMHYGNATTTRSTSLTYSVDRNTSVASGSWSYINAS